MSSFLYKFCYSVKTLCAIGQPFILNAVPLLANNYFPENQRTMATTIASVSNAVGVAFGFILPPAFASKASEIPFMLLMEAVILSVLIAPPLILFRSRPPTPPSLAASSQREQKFTEAIKSIFKSKDFVILFIVFGLALGAFNTLATIINELVDPFGYTNNDSGIFGALFVLLGLIGAGVVGAIVDKTRVYGATYKITLLACTFLGSCALLMFTLLLKPGKFELIAVAVSLVGFTMTPVLPISLELGCEVCYPIGEATPTGFLMTSGQIVGIIMIIATDQLISQGHVVAASWLVVALTTAAFLIMLLFNGKLKRLQHEKSNIGLPALDQ